MLASPFFARNTAHVDSQLITLLKDYWLPIVGAIAALAFWAHRRIAALLDDEEE